MRKRLETKDQLIDRYYRCAQVTFDTYKGAFEANPLDVRLEALARSYQKFECLFNLYVDLKRRSNEAGDPDLQA